MKLLRRADDLVAAYHWANVLKAAGIQCEVRNTALTGALGDIPFLEASPQIWVVNDFELNQAESILKEVEQSAPGATWTCPTCAEQCEAQFSSCWQCGTERTLPPI